MATLASRPQPTKNTFETAAWRFMRLSGILLVPLVFGHLAYIHLVNSVAVIEGAEWVREHRWAYLNVRIYDAFILWFAGLHGFNGLRVVINDYIHDKRINMAVNAAAGLLLVILLALGSLALIGPEIPGFAEGIPLNNPLENTFGGWQRFLE